MSKTAKEGLFTRATARVPVLLAVRTALARGSHHDGQHAVPSTPAYTVLASATCGSNGGGLTGCSVVQQPAVGAAGPLRWDFVGLLTPGGSGTVTSSVTIQ